MKTWRICEYHDISCSLQCHFVKRIYSKKTFVTEVLWWHLYLLRICVYQRQISGDVLIGKHKSIGLCGEILLVASASSHDGNHVVVVDRPFWQMPQIHTPHMSQDTQSSVCRSWLVGERCGIFRVWKCPLWIHLPSYCSVWLLHWLTATLGVWGVDIIRWRVIDSCNVTGRSGSSILSFQVLSVFSDRPMRDRQDGSISRSGTYVKVLSLGTI